MSSLGECRDGLFRQQGILFPIDVLSSAEVDEVSHALLRIEQASTDVRASLLAHKSHLVSGVLSDLVRHETILDNVERLLGPNILVWGSDFFIKEAGTPNFVSWHQDATYWGLTPHDVVTAWVALTPSTVESGCLRVIPGTHLQSILPHANNYGASNMLSRGQTIVRGFDESKAIDVVLAPGQMSLHHVKIAHGSNPNRSTHRRAGFAIRYIAAHVIQERDMLDTATLVRGANAFGHFALERAPKGELEPDDIVYHQGLWKVEQEIIAASAKQ
jgi:non-haem Fe2+, alpha-ketoglutarate-dependent halogenase